MRLPAELGLSKDVVGKQTRCVYGTRDAGMLWEETYRIALENIGFKTGLANPCLFNHAEFNIQVVVHGDDFTFLGTDDRLDWITDELKKVFEIKVRGRLGVGCPDSEIKILNRIVRIDERGLRYEADPRHCDLLIPSLGLQKGASVKTPGVKPSDPDQEAPKGEEGERYGRVIDPQGNVYSVTAQDADNPVSETLSPSDEGTATMQKIAKKAALKTLKEIVGDSSYDKKTVMIMAEPTDVYDITPYSELYSRHPRLLMATVHGMVRVPSNMDPYTSKSADVMRSRRAKYNLCNGQRVRDHYSKIHERLGDALFIHEHVPFSPLSAGAAAFIAKGPQVTSGILKLPPTSLYANRTASSKVKGPARKGAKAANKLERISSSGNLSPAEATVFRALSARANYLAQDRPDISFSTKELCREFAIPNQQSYIKLKRVVRYLIGLPRLVYHYDFQDDPKKFDVYTDSDFAGCKTSRRSTSGGVVMHGSHCIRHWSTTQSTLSLSSGESELHGIAKGVQNAIGFQSMGADIDFSKPMHIHSDATAAIGIARRRGLGKLRHLDVEDLWVQEQVRSKRVHLHKVLGTDNPADIFTKYVDHTILTKALKFMHLHSEDGRAATAPAAAGP